MDLLTAKYQCTVPRLKGNEFKLITDCLSASDFDYCFDEFYQKMSGLDEQKCQNFDFDFTGTGSIDDSKMTSMISDFNFVCDRSWIGFYFLDVQLFNEQGRTMVLIGPFIVSIKCISGILFCVAGSYISDNYGRKIAMLLCAGKVFFYILYLDFQSFSNGFFCDSSLHA